MSSVVVVTGAGYGVGRAVAEAFGRDGATVALLSRGEESLAAAERAIARSLAIPYWIAEKLPSALMSRYHVPPR